MNNGRINLLMCDNVYTNCIVMSSSFLSLLLFSFRHCVNVKSSTLFFFSRTIVCLKYYFLLFVFYRFFPHHHVLYIYHLFIFVLALLHFVFVGIVDKRVLPKLAKTLATLHTTNDFDPMFNDTTRPIVTSLRPLFKDIFGNTIDSYGTSAADPYDTSIQVAVKEIGQNEFNQMIDAMLDSFLNDRHCLVHNDAHCFNILVEKKPSISTLENFGPDANIFLVDWEMAVVGPHGVDPGKVLCYPIACAICHAMNGHKLEAYHILDCINEFWNHYESDLIDMRNGSSSSSSIDEEAEEVVVAAVEAADDDDSGGEAFMIDLYRLTLGWTSFMIYNAFYQLNLFHDTMPVQDLSLEHNSRAKGSYASVALKLMKFAHGSDRPTGLSLEKSKAFFNDLMTTEMDELLAIAAAAASKQHPRNKGRRSSMLRTTGKRVSVSEEMIAEVQRRMSSQHLQTEL